MLICWENNWMTSEGLKLAGANTIYTLSVRDYCS